MSSNSSIEKALPKPKKRPTTRRLLLLQVVAGTVIIGFVNLFAGTAAGATIDLRSTLTTRVRPTTIGLVDAQSPNGPVRAIRPPLAPVDPVGVLSAVSCATSRSCVAVGYRVTSSTLPEALIEAWNGHAWQVQTAAPTPPGATYSYLYGVSCSAPTACVAVGTFHTPSGFSTLAEAWNGRAWTVKTTPNPDAAPNSYLNSVSCTSPSSCFAVGDFYTASDSVSTLAEEWDGRAWKIRATPTPSNTIDSYLESVSCTSRSECMAVGLNVDTDRTGSTLAELWDGHAWSLQTTPNIGGALATELRSVSCSSRRSCMAVGYSDGIDATTSTLAEAWNGTVWTVLTTPNPTGLSDGLLLGVACSRPTACSAVGYEDYTDSDRLFVRATWIEEWNGATWTVQPSQNPSTINDELLGVACRTAAMCIAVGHELSSSRITLTLTERWNGVSWSSP